MPQSVDVLDRIRLGDRRRQATEQSPPSPLPDAVERVASGRDAAMTEVGGSTRTARFQVAGVAARVPPTTASEAGLDGGPHEPEFGTQARPLSRSRAGKPRPGTVRRCSLLIMISTFCRRRDGV